MEYISVEHQKLLAQRYKVAVMVVVGICLSVILYMVLARLITPREMTPGSETWKKPVYTAVVVLGLIVVILRRLLMSKMVSGRAARGVSSVLSNLTSMSVICAAAAEIIALIGLVLYFLTGDLEYSWRLGIVGLILVLYSFPRRGEWVRAVAVAEGK